MKRNRDFFGDDDYEFESEVDPMSLTMKEREFTECKIRIINLKKDIESLENRIASRK